MDNRVITSIFSLFLVVAMVSNTANVFASEKGKEAKDPVAMTDESQSIQVNKSSPGFVVRLPGNATTGYRWFLLDQPSQLYKMIRQRYISKDGKGKDQVGAGGYEEWVFKVDSKAFKFPLISQLHFVYGKPWRLSSHDLTEQQQKIFTVVLLQ